MGLDRIGHVKSRHHRRFEIDSLEVVRIADDAVGSRHVDVPGRVQGDSETAVVRVAAEDPAAPLIRPGPVVVHQGQDVPVRAVPEGTRGIDPAGGIHRDGVAFGAGRVGPGRKKVAGGIEDQRPVAAPGLVTRDVDCTVGADHHVPGPVLAAQAGRGRPDLVPGRIQLHDPVAKRPPAHVVRQGDDEVAGGVRRDPGHVLRRVVEGEASLPEKRAARVVFDDVITVGPGARILASAGHVNVVPAVHGQVHGEEFPCGGKIGRPDLGPVRRIEPQDPKHGRRPGGTGGPDGPRGIEGHGRGGSSDRHDPLLHPVRVELVEAGQPDDVEVPRVVHGDIRPLFRAGDDQVLGQTVRVVALDAQITRDRAVQRILYLHGHRIAPHLHGDPADHTVTGQVETRRQAARREAARVGRNPAQDIQRKGEGISFHDHERARRRGELEGVGIRDAAGPPHLLHGLVVVAEHLRGQDPGVPRVPVLGRGGEQVHVRVHRDLTRRLHAEPGDRTVGHAVVHARAAHGEQVEGVVLHTAVVVHPAVVPAARVPFRALVVRRLIVALRVAHVAERAVHPGVFPQQPVGGPGRGRGIGRRPVGLGVELHQGPHDVGKGFVQGPRLVGIDQTGRVVRDRVPVLVGHDVQRRERPGRAAVSVAEVEIRTVVPGVHRTVAARLVDVRLGKGPAVVETVPAEHRGDVGLGQLEVLRGRDRGRVRPAPVRRGVLGPLPLRGVPDSPQAVETVEVVVLARILPALHAHHAAVFLGQAIPRDRGRQAGGPVRTPELQVVVTEQHLGGLGVDIGMPFMGLSAAVREHDEIDQPFPVDRELRSDDHLLLVRRPDPEIGRKSAQGRLRRDGRGRRDVHLAGHLSGHGNDVTPGIQVYDEVAPHDRDAVVGLLQPDVAEPHRIGLDTPHRETDALARFPSIDLTDRLTDQLAGAVLGVLAGLSRLRSLRPLQGLVERIPGKPLLRLLQPLVHAVFPLGTDPVLSRFERIRRSRKQSQAHDTDQEDRRQPAPKAFRSHSSLHLPDDEFFSRIRNRVSPTAEGPARQSRRSRFRF